MTIFIDTPDTSRMKDISDELGVSLAELSVAFRNMAADAWARGAQDVRNGHGFDPEYAERLTALAEQSDVAWEEYERPEEAEETTD